MSAKGGESGSAAAIYLDPRTLTPWKGNPRKNDPAVQAVAESIRRFGFGAPILARRGGEIIAGHTRLKAAISLGLTSVPVRYLDLTETEAHALALADNKLGEIAGWDDAGLAAVLAELEAAGEPTAGLGWDDAEIDALIAAATAAGRPEPEDEAPDLEPEAHSTPGAVYDLGPHRLLCGDSAEPASWDRLLGGERLRMVWTDPPYGVSIVGGTKDPRAPGYRSGGRIENDDLNPDQLREFLAQTLGALARVCEPGAVWYVAAAPGPLFQEFGSVLLGLGIWRQTLIWVKNSFVFGRSDYHYRHEPIFYGWVPGAAHKAPDSRKLDSVIEVDRPSKSQDHPTMKPIKLVQGCIEASSEPGWLVGDAFGGSGTTLLAAAACGRRARLIEKSPQYCDVIRRRWTKYATDAGIGPGSGAL